MIKQRKVIAVHLLNDFSGSPLIFTQALQGLQQSGYEVILHTSRSRKGFLNRLNVPVVNFPYRFFSSSLLRLFAFTFSQVIVFFQLLRYRKEDVVIYVNTLLPFGAAWAGKLMKKPVMYHLHESYIRPKILRDFLKFSASHTACTALYVSHYLLDTEKLENVNCSVVYNALPDEFISRSSAVSYHIPSSGSFIVLMISSLKTYKGIHEFVSLAGRHHDLKFELVLNASEDEILEFFESSDLPLNLSIFPAQPDVHPFYQRASLVVNLTNPAQCVETFGMTLLEAMCYGIPVIAPPVGGPAEIVTPGTNGFAVDVRNTSALDSAIQELKNHPEILLELSKGAKNTAGKFTGKSLQQEVIRAVDKASGM